MKVLERKNWNNFFLGLAVALLPFLGLPWGIKRILFLALGLLIALFSFARLRRLPPEFSSTESPDHESNA